MRYVVLCHTNIVDRSERNHPPGSTRTMLQCVNRKDAERMADGLADMDCEPINDGPYVTSRTYEVAAELFTSSLSGNRKLTLTLSDLEMIASEYTRPAMAAE